MKRLILGVLIALTLFLVACNNEGTDNNINTDFIASDEDMFTDKDLSCDYESTDVITIELKGDKIESSTQLDINEATLTIKDGSTYLITGNLNNGQIIIDAPNQKPTLLLSGVSITTQGSCPIYVKSCKKTFITLCKDTANYLASQGEYIAIDENNIDSVIFAKDDLTINGEGTLEIDAQQGNGIVGKDDLVITNGAYIIKAQNHGIDANNSVRLSTPNITINSGKDGIHVENEDETKGYAYISKPSLTIDSGGDGIDASSNVQIENGTIKITTTQGEETDSYKGIKSGATILLNNGTLEINSYDDCLHGTDILINECKAILSSSDDGVHADNTLIINNGEITIEKSYEGLEAQNITINNGNIVLTSSDDGINAAGGTDNSGFGGGFSPDNFGRPGQRPGGMGGDMGGGMGSTSSDGSIIINGGTVNITANGDGIDANGYLEINGGFVTVCGPTQGDTAVLDYDLTGTINGGSFIGTGSSMMAQTLTSTTHGIISLSVGNQSSGSTITVTDSQGNVLLSYTPKLNYAIFIVSIPELIKGESYTVKIGDLEGTFEAQ
ncbi:MAG: carbohydrate-binding domain-containing protein [Clostridia bacterium]|nr:carbohydrate-binding domain-containing protein [Clostridia bacterium]